MSPAPVHFITRLTWGLAPFSARRLGRALLALLAPAVVWGLLFVAGKFWLEPHRYEALAVTAALASLGLGVLMVLARAMQAVPVNLRPESRDELRLAGVSPFAWLWGANSPGLCGAVLVAVVHGLFFVAAYWSYYHEHIAPGATDPRTHFSFQNGAFIFIITTLPTVMMVIGAFLEAALRVLAPSLAWRAVIPALLAVGIVGSIIVMPFVLARIRPTPEINLETLAIVMIVPAEILAAGVAVLAWRKALRRLGSPE